jgi:hypothetical protein
VASAFVSKLAAAGAQDPEALAAWIGRKKHGKGAFAKLAASGRKSKSRSATESSATRSAGAQGGTSQADAAKPAAALSQGERLARINAAPGAPARPVTTPEERSLISAYEQRLTRDTPTFRRAQRAGWGDEEAQTDRVGVLRARAFKKAEAERRRMFGNSSFL